MLLTKINKKVDHATRLSEDDKKAVVTYHHTDVVVFDKVTQTWTLNSGGWRTPTTKRRINEYSPFHVFQRDHEWYVKAGPRIMTFKDGMELKSYETL